MGTESSCGSLTGLLWLTSISYSLQFLFLFQLLFVSEGAVYSQIMQGFTLPLSTLFWTLFEDKTYVRWYPHFSMQTLCIIIGLAIMVPAVACYDYYACTEDEMDTHEAYTELKEGD